MGPAATARRAWPLLASALWIGAMALRLPGLNDDLWLDEVWSLAWIRDTDHWWELLTTRHHEINHWLMSLILRATGAEPAWHARLAPLLMAGAGLGVVAVAGRRRPVEMLWLLLLASSTLLIHYSTEARGYAGAICMALIAIVSARSWLGDGNERARWPLAVSLAVGIGFHPSFAFVSAGAAAWIIVARFSSLPPAQALRGTLLVLLLPVIAAGAAFISIRQMQVGGSIEHSASAALLDLASFALGTGPGWLLIIGATVFIGLCALELASMLRNRDPEAALYILGILVAPALLTAARGEPFVLARHFLIVLPLALLLLSRALVRTAALGTAGRAISIGFTLMLVGANLLQWQDWARHDRGSPREALAFVVAHSPPAGLIGIASDNDFRNGQLVEYHAPHARGGERIRYVYDGEWAALFPDWLIVSRFETDSRPTPRMIRVGEATYRLERTFPSAPVSGCLWALFHRTGDAP